MKIVYLTLFLLFSTHIWAQDFEALSVENREGNKEPKLSSLSKLDISISLSTTTLRHWETKQISTYSLDNTFFVGYAITKNSYIDMQGKISTYKNFGEAASFGDDGDTNFTELSFKYGLKNLLPQNSLGISLSVNLQHTFFTYTNAHIYSNKNGYDQLTLLFSKFLKNMSFSVKPYFSNNYIHGSKNLTTGDNIDTVKSAVGVSFSQYFNLTKNCYIYSGQSFNHYYGFYRPDKDTVSISFGVGGNFSNSVGYYLGTSFYDAMKSGDGQLWGEDFYRYPSFGIDLYFFLF